MPETLRDQLIGAWKLVSYVEKPVDGSAPSYPLGENAQGLIMYTPDGYMSAQLMRPDAAPRGETRGRYPPPQHAVAN